MDLSTVTEPQYVKSDNPDMVYCYRVVKEEIWLRGITNGLEEQIARLNTELESIPEPVAYPDKVTEDIKTLIDEKNAKIPDTSEIEKKRDELQTFLEKLQEVK